MSEVTVVVATYGSAQWEAWGDLAAGSVEGAPVVRVHQRASLARVRNEGLRRVETERVCFLDGDDRLAPGYLDRSCEADVVVTPLDGAFPVVGAHRHQCEPRCLPEGNYIHIGAIVRTDLLTRLGGFREHPIYEDWDLWLRCHYAGATFVSSPGPSYLTHQQGVGGRNTALSPVLRRRATAFIRTTARFHSTETGRIK